MQLHGHKLRAYLDDQPVDRQLTQITDAIRPVTTGPLPIIEPPASVVIHLGGVLPSLIDLTPMTQNVIISAYRMAYQNRRVRLQDAAYYIAEIWPDHQQAGRILARLERLQEDA